MEGIAYKRKSGKGRKYGLAFCFLGILFALSFSAYKLISVPAPAVDGTDGFAFLPRDKTVRLQGKNLSSIRITVSQGTMDITILEDVPDKKDAVYSLSLKPREIGLRDGDATVTVMAKSGILKTEQYTVEAVIDTVPPSLEVLRATGILKQGAGGVAVLDVSGADSVFVMLGDLQFNAFEIKTDDKGGLAHHVVFFPVPYNAGKDSVYHAVATDRVGNRTVKALPTRIKTKNFGHSSIDVTGHFIKGVVMPLLNLAEVPDPAQAFRQVNEELRNKDLDTLLHIGKESAERKMWKDSFLQLSNSMVMATYGDQRTYLYAEEPIGTSVHLGYDLASVEHAPVEASNSGIVKFTGDLGVYGKTIVIDHGLALMSLYGHLSEIHVKEGQDIHRGDIIAKTGSSGFAAGDHLHFGILIHGIEVSPLFWWDSNWIKVKIDDIYG